MTPKQPPLAAGGGTDLRRPDLYFNRELSLLEFNRRVLAQSRDESVPLLERLRFLCISSTNLDEFFEIRVAGLKQKMTVDTGPTGPENMTPAEVLSIIDTRAHELVDEQYRILREELLPALEQEGITFIRRSDWTREETKWLNSFFRYELLPLLSPLGLDPAHPFPRILNKSLNFIVDLSGKDAFGRNSGMAVMQAPRALPRLIQLPAEGEGQGYRFVFLSSIIHAFADKLFPGMTVKGCYQFRVTRNSELFIDTEEVEDLLTAMEGELASRRYGDEVRLEMADNCPDHLVQFLLDQFELDRADLYMVDGPVNINRLQGVLHMVEKKELLYPPFNAAQPKALEGSVDIFTTLQKQDVLLHHPYVSFMPVLEFVRQAARDPDVLAIKQTLYRTDADSVIVDELVTAARKGKEVIVVVELMARFDEQANISLATRLQEAGAHVVYGVVGYKTHAKMILVVRREGRKLRNYVHLGTGNYHSSTARTYTDYGLLSCDEELGRDVHQVFWQLTSLGKASKLKKIIQSPFDLHHDMIEKIEREIRQHRKHGNGRIIIKVNSLVESQIIQSLYAASMAGVRIDLIVRGMCCLRPGVPGISDNITVRSIVGRFLEHHRVYVFSNNKKPEVYCSSADWIERNFFRRVEVCFPIQTKAQREQIIADLELYLKDNTQAWTLGADGEYQRIGAGSSKTVSAQQELLHTLADAG